MSGLLHDLLSPGGRRVSAMVLLVAATALGATCIILALAVLLKARQVSGEMIAACTSLGAVAGYAYAKNKEVAAEVGK